MASHSTALRIDPSLLRFARLLHDELGATHVLLFGSRARGDARVDSDYDLIVVSPSFTGIEPPRRAIGLRQRWYAVGGEGAMDLVCVTPDEFDFARHRISLIAAVLPEALDLLAETTK